MGIDIHQDKERAPLTRVEVLERIEQAHRAGTNVKLVGEILTNSDLRGLDFSGADLSSADLSSADLSRANFSGANFSGADLSGAYLSRANFSGTNFSGTNFSRANFSRAKLSRAYLPGADLSGANFSGADLSRAKLSGAILSNADLSNADLSNADLSNADLSNADLSRAILSRAILSNADLSRADLSNADLSEIDLNNIKLDGAILRDVLIKNKKKADQDTETSTLQIRLAEEPFSSQHLADTIATFRSLLTKLWLLQQGRMQDFERYSAQPDITLENEVPLSIRFSVNSPANIQFNFDLSPKGFVEALQQLIDTFLQWKQRRRKGELDLMKQQIEIAEQSLSLAQHMVEAVAPNLSDEEKGAAIQSVLKDIHRVAQDTTFEISLQLPQLPVPQVQVIPDIPSPQGSTQPK
jgi:uncharacterized protein YjbI with pentapeptide repeats